MRRDEREIKDQEKIYEIINRSQTCYLAMSLDDQPYVVPVNFGIDGNVLYIHSAPEGRKIETLRKNPKVSVLFDVDQEVLDRGTQACKWSTKYRSVIGFGTASIIEDDAQKIEAYNCIMHHYAPDKQFTYNEKSVSASLIIKVDLDSLTGKSSGY